MRINANQLHELAVMQTAKDGPGWDISSWVWHRPIVEIGDPLTDSLMGSFLIEVFGIVRDNSCQMPTPKDEGMAS